MPEDLSLRHIGIIFTVLDLLQTSKVFEPQRVLTGFVSIVEVLLVLTVSKVLYTGAVF